MKLKDTIHFDWYKKALLLVFIILFTLFSIGQTDANFYQFFTNTNQMAIFFNRFLQPDLSYVAEALTPLLETMQMSVVGTFIGVIFAVPFAFLATTVITESPLFTFVIRLLLSIIRTIPTLLLGALLVAVFGIGPGTGVITIAVFTFGMVSQLIYEAVESIDYAPIEAMNAVGANKIKVVVWAIIPQVLVYIVSYTLYAFEVNIRASLVLGYVGAGGIGVLLNTSMSLSRYDRVAVVIFIIFAVIMVIDFLSENIRARLI